MAPKTPTSNWYSVEIDNPVFRLQYKATVILLLACFLVAFIMTYVFQPVKCSQKQNDQNFGPEVTMYCSSPNTSMIPNPHKLKLENEGKNVNEKEIYYDSNFQWVCVVLLFQAASFCLTKHLWQYLENGKVRSMILGFNSPALMKKGKIDHDKGVVSSYLLDTLNTNNSYAYAFFACEVLNFTNVLAQITFLNYFLNGQFMTYGFRALTLNNNLYYIFPRLTNCIYFTHGPSGNLVRYDIPCTLPVNTVNEKIFFILWWWFFMLVLANLAVLIYRGFLILCPNVRIKVLRAYHHVIKPDDVIYAENVLSVGDWFVLMQLGKNIGPLYFREVLKEFMKKLKSHNSLASKFEEDIM